MNEYHKIDFIRFEQDFIVLKTDGVIYRIILSEVSSKLASAAEAIRNNFIVSPSGYGIHWPLIDEDLSIDGLIRHTQMENKKADAQLA